jgi:hypothetical protein
MYRIGWTLLLLSVASVPTGWLFAQAPGETTLEQALRVPGAPTASPLPPTPKLPVPSDAAQAEAMALVREVYKSDYDKAKTVADKQALAKKMLGKAAETRDDPAGQFVLLKLAREIATQTGDGQTAFQAVDETARVFQVDGLEMKTEVLASLAKKARQPAEHKFVVEQALLLIEQAVAADKFELADTLGVTALGSVRQAGATGMAKQLRSRMEEVKQIAEGFEKVKAAATILESKPTDPEANLIVGQYECLVKNDWDKGLPMLALGSDPALKTLAVKELEGAIRPDEQVKLGDGWWALAEKEEGTAKNHLQGRAGYWYRRALPSLSGLVKDKAKKRVDGQIVTGGDAAPAKPFVVGLDLFGNHERFLVASQNSRLVSEEKFRYWAPAKLGQEGTIVYRFDFPQKVKKAQFRCYTDCFYQFDKNASVQIEVSSDGKQWVAQPELSLMAGGSGVAERRQSCDLTEVLNGKNRLFIRARLHATKFLIAPQFLRSARPNGNNANSEFQLRVEAWF